MEDTKVFANVENQHNVEQLRTDLTAIYQWSFDWQRVSLNTANQTSNHPHVQWYLVPLLANHLLLGVWVTCAVRVCEVLVRGF